METSKITIKAGSGTYNTLDKMYNRFIKNYLTNTNEETKERWQTYESIIAELVRLDRADYFDEIKYRLTGGENPNDIISDIIDRDNEIKKYLWSHILKIRDYENLDLLRRFYK